MQTVKETKLSKDRSFVSRVSFSARILALYRVENISLSLIPLRRPFEVIHLGINGQPFAAHPLEGKEGVRHSGRVLFYLLFIPVKEYA